MIRGVLCLVLVLLLTASPAQADEAFVSVLALGQGEAVAARSGAFGRPLESRRGGVGAVVVEAEALNISARLRLEAERHSGAGRLRHRVQIQELAHRSTLGPSTRLTLGKTVLNWDVTYANRPLGFFPTGSDRGDVEDRAVRTAGLPLVALSQGLGTLHLTAVVSEDFGTERDGFGRGRTQAALRVAGAVGATDLAAVVHWAKGLSPALGGSVTHVRGQGLELHASALVRAGHERPRHAAAEGSSVRFYGPGEDPYSRSRERDGRWYAQATLGGQYTTDSLVNILVEAVYDGRGLSPTQWGRLRDLNTALAAAGQTGAAPAAAVAANRALTARSLLPQGSRRLYGFVRLTQVWGDVTPEASAFIGLEDGSASLAARLTYAPSPTWDAWLEGRVAVGPPGSEFGESPERARLAVVFRRFF